MGPTNRWKLGLFVVTCFFGSLLLLSWAGASRLDRESIRGHYFFDEVVDGLSVGSPVKFRGVPIGKVVGIHAAPDRRNVEVKADIFLDALEDLGLARESQGPEDGPFVHESLRAQLVTSILTGESFIQNDFFNIENYPVPEYSFELPWNTVHTVPSTTKSLADGLAVVSEHLPTMMEDLSRVLGAVEEAVQGAHLADLLEQISSLLVVSERRLSDLDELPILRQGVTSLAQAESTLAEVEGLLKDLRQGGDVGEMAASFTRMSTQLARAADEVAILSTELRGDLQGLDETLRSIRRLADLLEQDPGSLLYGREQRSLEDLDVR